MYFFDFLFYNVAKKLNNKFEEVYPTLNTSHVLAALQFMNISSIVLLIYFLRGLTWQDLNKYIAGGLYFSMIIINHARYFYIKKYDYYAIKYIWEKKTEKQKRAYNILFILYVVISISAFIVLIILLPSGRQD